MTKKIFSMLLFCVAVVLTSCDKDNSEPDPIGVAFSNLTANGSTTETTTVLTLTFDKAIEGLTAEDITLASGSTGATKGTLTDKGNGVYELAVSTISEASMLAVTVVKTGYAITPKSREVTVNLNKSITWATGNLVAKADGSGCEIGAATDGGLYFQFGSLVGWAGGANGDGKGTPANGLTLAVKVKPAGYTAAPWSEDWEGNPTEADASTGKGDPCHYYLGDTWRLPTKEEYEKLFNNVIDGKWTNSGGWDWTASPASATHNDGKKFPASGYRSYKDGSLTKVGEDGCYWSASPDDEHNGYFLDFRSSEVNPSYSYFRPYGYPVRCVRE